jgi:hypothetical protein
MFLSNILSQITVRGSQIRGKQVEAAHTLLPTKYGFVRGTSKNVIEANKTKAAQLLKKAAFHFKVLPWLPMYLTHSE